MYYMRVWWGVAAINIHHLEIFIPLGFTIVHMEPLVDVLCRAYFFLYSEKKQM